jgi:uncharacterized integral membrane protein (TIGR00698 family)
VSAVYDIEKEAASAQTVLPPWIPWTRTAAIRLGILLPGLAITAALAATATVLGRLAPVIGAPVIAIVGGMVISLVRRPAARFKPGIAFASRRVLQASIVVLGTGLSLGQVLSTGGRSLPVLIGTLVAALGMAWLAGRALGLTADVRTLIGIGTAVCGASAIAATDAVIDADEADVSYAIATIFTFNVVAVLLYPTLGHALGLSQHAFGLWAGTAINDLSSVVAASTIYGHAAASYGVIVKLTRTLAIVPICLSIAVFRGWRQQEPVGTSTGGRIRMGRILPLFIVVFVGAVVANTTGLVPSGWHHPLSDLSTWMITAALGAIGLSTDFAHIRRAGFRPLAMGAVLWLTVGLASLGLQALTGTL